MLDSTVRWCSFDSDLHRKSLQVVDNFTQGIKVMVGIGYVPRASGGDDCAATAAAVAAVAPHDQLRRQG